MTTYILQFRGYDDIHWKNLTNEEGFPIEFIHKLDAQSIAVMLSNTDIGPMISNKGNSTWRVIDSQGNQVWEA